MKIFAPATKLMKTLKYPAKFALISFVFLMPIGVLIFSLFSEIQAQIDFAEKELLGSKYLRSVHQLSQSFFRYQILDDQANLVSSPPRQLPTLEATVGSDLQELRKIDQQLGSTLRTQERVENIKSNWDLLNKNKSGYSPETRNELPRCKQTGYQNQKRASCSSRWSLRYSLP